MDIAQSFGSSSSYARKYSLNGLFLIDDTKDADATNTHGKTSTSNKKELLTPKHPKFDNHQLHQISLRSVAANRTLLMLVI